jgi:hypothetical protein
MDSSLQIISNLSFTIITKQRFSQDGLEFGPDDPVTNGRNNLHESVKCSDFLE